MSNSNNSIVKRLLIVTSDSNTSKNSSSFVAYRDKMKEKGLLKQDCFDWPISSNPKENNEPPLKHSKNHVLCLTTSDT